MQTNAVNLGTSFMKLVLARDSNLRDDIAGYDGDDTNLLNYYVLATDADGYEYVYADKLGTTEIVRVNTIAVHGGDNGVRCYAKTVTAYKDAQGELWLDAEMHDEVFC